VLLVLVIASVWLAACNASGTADVVTASEDWRAASRQAAAPIPSPSPSPKQYSPPMAKRYTVAANEPYPKAKQLAVDVTYTLTNYEPDTGFASLVEQVAGGRDRRQALREAARPLFQTEMWSRGRVVYPQLGGVTQDRMSVMVVVEQRTGTARAERTVSRTLDVRLKRGDNAWVFDRLASAGGAPIDRPQDLPAVAAAVVDNPRIELPDSAKWDIYRGAVAPGLLRLMTALADRTPYAVVTLSSGHPHNVFGTDRQSNHTKGRAFDIYAFDERPVADRGSTTRTHVDWLFGRPDVAELGSPWALDGYGGRSFTDVVHRDHVHVGV
jgi:hypothetical protein